MFLNYSRFLNKKLTVNSCRKICHKPQIKSQMKVRVNKYKVKHVEKVVVTILAQWYALNQLKFLKRETCQCWSKKSIN